MDDADRVCRLPDDDWQDYDTTYAAEVKTKKEGILLHSQNSVFYVLFCRTEIRKLRIKTKLS